jgi:hypothetical protein
LSDVFGASFYERLFDLFLNLKAELIPWVGAIVMVRVLINLAMFKSVADMSEIIKDVFFGMLLLCFFIEIVKFSQVIPNILHEKLSSPDQMEIKLPDRGIGPSDFTIWTLTSYIAVGAYWISKLIYTLFVGILIVTGAFVIIAGTMLAQRYLLNLFFISLFGSSLMPLFWYSINEALKFLVRPNDHYISNFFLILFGELFKIGTPLVAVGFFVKNPFVAHAKNGAEKGAKVVKGLANAAAGTAASFTNPNSKVSQMYKVWSGKDKISNLNSFPNLKKHYEHQKNKAAFNNWLHDKSPPKNNAQSGGAKSMNSKSQSTSKTTAQQNNKADVKQSAQNTNQFKNTGAKPVTNVNAKGAENQFAKAQTKSVDAASKSTKPNTEVQGIKKQLKTDQGKNMGAKLPDKNITPKSGKEISNRSTQASKMSMGSKNTNEIAQSRAPEKPVLNLEIKLPNPKPENKSEGELNL